MTGEQAAKDTRETAQVIRMSDYHPKKKGALTYLRFRKAEDERPSSQLSYGHRGNWIYDRSKWEERQMWKLLTAVLAIAALCSPAAAQTPVPQHGLKSGYIAWTYTGEVLPGQMDNFKQVVSKVIAAVAQEPGTLMYEWNFRQDQKTFDVIELYQSSEAALAHVKHVVAEFGKDLGQVQKGLQLTIYGSPDAQVKQVVEGFNPVYQTHFEGFIR
jgi:quinol monooxygenase YgiN